MKVVSGPEFLPLIPASETEREKAIRNLADAIHRTNQAVLRAVDAGACIELIRTSRYHDGRGHWGDQIMPAIRAEGPVCGEHEVTPNRH